MIFSLIQMLLITVPQEYRVVHGNAQLEDGGNRLCNKGYLAHEVIGSHVIQNGNADAQQEQDRRQIGINQQHHRKQRQYDGDHYILAFLCVCQVLQIHDHGGHSGNEAFLGAYLPHLGHRVEGPLIGRLGIEEYADHGGIILAHIILHLLRIHLPGNIRVEHILEIDHVGDVVDLLILIGHVLDLVFIHIFCDDDGESSLAKIITQQILTFHRLYIPGQVGQHVIIDPGGIITHDRWNKKKQRDDQDCMSVLDNLTSKSHELAPLGDNFPYITLFSTLHGITKLTISQYFRSIFLLYTFDYLYKSCNFNCLAWRTIDEIILTDGHFDVTIQIMIQ